MKCSFDGIGQWAATFPRVGGGAGQVAALDSNGAVCPCQDNGEFLGVILAVGRGGEACSAVLGGIVTVPCAGDAPAPGWAGLAADGKGGVKASDNGRAYRVLASTDDSVTFIL